MNQGIFSGRIGRDAEVRQMPNGDPVCNFPLAVDVGTRDNPETMWIDCSLFGKRGQNSAQWLTKGTKLFVHGRLTLATFTKKDGTTDKGLRLNLTEFDFGGSRNDDQSQKSQVSQSQHHKAKSNGYAPKQSTYDDDDDDGIPF